MGIISLVACSLSELHELPVFHDAAATRGRLNAYVEEAELEPGDEIGKYSW